jgi:hypothetical protein
MPLFGWKKTSILSMFINCWPPQHFAIVDTTRKLTNKLTNSNDDVTIRTGIGKIIINSCCVSYYHWNRFWLVGIYLNNLMKLCLLWSLFWIRMNEFLSFLVVRFLFIQHLQLGIFFERHKKKIGFVILLDLWD